MYRGGKHLSYVTPLMPLKPIRVHCGKQEEVHAIHNPPCPLICILVLAQPFRKPKQKLPVRAIRGCAFSENIGLAEQVHFWCGVVLCVRHKIP